MREEVERVYTLGEQKKIIKNYVSRPRLASEVKENYDDVCRVSSSTIEQININSIDRMRIRVFVDDYRSKWRKFLVIRRSATEENMAAYYPKNKNNNVIYVWGVMPIKYYMCYPARQLDIIFTRQLDDYDSDFNIRLYREYGYDPVQYDVTTCPDYHLGIYYLVMTYKSEIENRLHKYNGTLEIIR